MAFDATNKRRIPFPRQVIADFLGVAPICVGRCYAADLGILLTLAHVGV